MPSQAILKEKEAVVAQLTERLQGATAAVVVDYKGITVEDDTKLRKTLREAGVNYTVVKNSLLSRAADNAGYGELKDVLTGTTALATSDEDLVAQKLLNDYAKTNDKFTIKGGIFEGKVIDAATVTELANVPPREVLLAMFLGGLNATVTGLARALNAVAEKKGEGAAEAPAEESAE